MSIPEKYKWIEKEPAPKVLIEAVKLHGTREISGTADNPEILKWSRELNLKNYIHDSIAWCGLFVALCVKRAGYEVVKEPLWAHNWVNFGIAVSIPMLGDVLVFKRTSGGHVGFYVGEDTECYHVFGGNQSDQVSITRIEKSRLVAARRSPFKISQPQNIRVIHLASDGVVSKNEA
jgi:uncharacterized protein (TIGR02594 family)